MVGLVLDEKINTESDEWKYKIDIPHLEVIQFA